jgi:hypothetical protein
MLKAFVFLATVYGANGPNVYVLDDSLTGADCIARMETGITSADVLAVVDERLHVEGVAAKLPDLSGAVLSCEFDMGDD